MAETKDIVIGIFEDRQAVIDALSGLVKGGFKEEELGFAARSRDEHVQQIHRHVAHHPHAITRGIIGGILGAADLLLVPITGPFDATQMLNTALPVVDEAIDRLPKVPEKRAPHATRTATTEAEGEDEAEELKEENTSSITGGVVGMALGAAAAALLLPGIGPLVAGGIIVSALGSGAIGSSAALYPESEEGMPTPPGGEEQAQEALASIDAALVTLGVPQEIAPQYEQDIKDGRTIVVVKTAEQKEKATELMQQYGAQRIQAY